MKPASQGKIDPLSQPKNPAESYMYQAMILNQPQLTVPLPHRNVQGNRENVNMDRVEGLMGMIGDQIGLNGGLEFAPFQANEVVAPLPVAARPPTPPAEPERPSAVPPDPREP